MPSLALKPVPTGSDQGFSSPGTRARSAVIIFRQATLIVLLLALAIAAQLSLSAVSSANAYRISSLNSERQKLGLKTSQLNQELSVYNSPQYLARRLQAIGMTGVSDPVFLKLSDHQVLGSPRPALASNQRLGDAVPNVLLKSAIPVSTPSVIPPTRAQSKDLLARNIFLVPQTS